MTTFASGSNRDKVYQALNSTPKDLATLRLDTGLAEKPIVSALNQIGALGYVEAVKQFDGKSRYIKGADKAVETRNGKPSDAIHAYLIKNVGQVVTINKLASELGMKSRSSLYTKLGALTKENHLTVVREGPPKQWQVNQSLIGDDLAEPTEQIQHALFPASISPMQTSDAISHLMQTEQQNIMYQHAIQRLTILYEQMGNILETLGVLESD